MKYIIAIAILALSLGCGRFGNNDGKAGEGSRIVCLSKHLTEMMFALGKGNELVAVDLSSTFPDSAKLLKTVGYHRALNAEGIISMEPDLVIHSNDIGPETVLPQIIKAGLKVKVFGGSNTYDSAVLLLHELGTFFNAEKEADSLSRNMDSGMSQVAATLKSMNSKDTPSVMIIHFGRANNVYFVMSGRNGAGDRMLKLAGAKAAIYDAKGARQISAEAIATSNPDIIIATDYGYDQMGSMEKFIENIPGLALTNAGKNKRIIRFEEHDLVYFGPRTPANLVKLMNLIHSDVKK